jgi:hypothetical protein
MDTNYPAEAWQRLGTALERRRGQLGYGYRQRGTFLRDSGVNLSVKTIARLERGERDSYPAGTISLIETLYRVKPGSVDAVLRGGELTPEDVPGERRRHYDDPRLQAIEQLDFPPDVRRGMIRFAEGWLGIGEGGEAAQMAGLAR